MDRRRNQRPAQEGQQGRQTVRIVCATGTALGGISRLVAEILHHIWI